MNFSEELAGLTSADGALAIAPLGAMSAVRRAALLRRWLASRHAVMPSRAMLSRIWDEVAQARDDATPSVHLNGYEVRRYQGKLWWIKSRSSLSDVVLNWPSVENALVLPHGAGSVSLTNAGHVRLPEADEPVTVRFKAGGLLHIVGRNGGRKLKKIWQEHNIPPWLRDTTPLLFYGETLVAAAGVFITQEGWTDKGFVLSGRRNGQQGCPLISSGFAHHDGADFRMAEAGYLVEAQFTCSPRILHNQVFHVLTRNQVAGFRLQHFAIF